MSDYNFLPDIPPWFGVMLLIFMGIGFLTVAGGIIYLIIKHVRIVW